MEGDIQYEGRLCRYRCGQFRTNLEEKLPAELVTLTVIFCEREALHALASDPFHPSTTEERAVPSVHVAARLAIHWNPVERPTVQLAMEAPLQAGHRSICDLLLMSAWVH